VAIGFRSGISRGSEKNCVSLNPVPQKKRNRTQLSLVTAPVLRSTTQRTAFSGNPFSFAAPSISPPRLACRQEMAFPALRNRRFAVLLEQVISRAVWHAWRVGIGHPPSPRPAGRGNNEKARRCANKSTLPPSLRGTPKAPIFRALITVDPEGRHAKPYLISQAFRSASAGQAIYMPPMPALPFGSGQASARRTGSLPSFFLAKPPTPGS